MKQFLQPIHRKRVWVGARVVLLTYLAVFAQTSGYLTRAENVLYDQRVAYCQHFMPRPTDRLVHLDVDDDTVTQVGRWPWHRDLLAEILDEVRASDPKILAMDVLFSEPEELSYDKSGKSIDRDAVLTDTVNRFDRVLLPSSFNFTPPPRTDRATAALARLVTDDLELTPALCVERIGRANIPAKDPDAWAAAALLSARPRAMYERIHRELAEKADSRDANTNDADAKLSPKQRLEHRILPHMDLMFVGSVLDRLFDEQYDRVLRERSLYRFTLSIPEGAPPALRAYELTTPVLPLIDAANRSGFVDYLPDQAEGTVRTVPLFSRTHDRLVPHMDLVIACSLLDVDVHDVRIGQSTVTIPRPHGQDIVIPVYTRSSTVHGDVGLMMQVPMFGKRGNWLTMYDFPNHEQAAQHVSVYEVWRVCMTRHRIAANEALADKVLAGSLGLTNPQAAADFKAMPPAAAVKQKMIDDVLDTMSEMRKGLAELPAADLSADDQKLLTGLTQNEQQLREVRKWNALMREQLDQLRHALRAKLKGKAVILGGTATGHVDQYPTSLHATCPGVVVHGAIVNAILTGKMWRMAPPYLTTLLTAAMGLVCGVFASKLSPAKAFVATASLSGGYLLFNAFVLFDHNGLIVGAAGPAFAAGLVWSAITLFDYISEATERARITARFSNYVDPSLVNWVIKHPDKARFDGESREMSMGFTDLAGFTTLTEQLGEKTVTLLSEYMGRMIPIIRAEQGYVSRLMGDGIYFFFGAPEPDEHHAAHAVRAALAMHQAVDKLNQILPGRGFPQLSMRAGVSTGRVVIGDAGSAEFSDYTALGDSVNTAARLETANKFFGTRTLMTARTLELLDGKFLARPIANLRVAGKTKGVQVYEPLCLVTEATPEQQRLFALTEAVVGAFQRQELEACGEAIHQLEKAFHRTKFTELYRQWVTTYLELPPKDFDGQIILSEK